MKTSAGLLLYRRDTTGVQVFLVHPGGPVWARRDEGAWSIPKGLYEPGEEPLSAAKREFHEETGHKPGQWSYAPLSPVVQAGGKTVQAWACEGDCDAADIHSNSFTMEWPPRSGRVQSFPEVDRAAWFALDEARVKITPAQAAFLDQLGALLD